MLLTILANNLMPNTPVQFRAPVYSKYERRDVIDYGVGAQNLLLTTLAVTAAPFTPVLFEQLRAPAPLAAYASDQYRVNTLLLSATPASNHDWPNPVARSSALQFWTYGTLPYFQTAVPPFSQTDWQNPASRKTAQDFAYQGTLLLPVLVSGFPFSQTDWQNPVPRRTGQDWSYSTIAYALLVQPAPFVPYDFGNPVSRKGITQDWDYGLLPYFQTAVPPFSKTDWPNPATRQYGQDFNYQGTILQPTPAAVQFRAPVLSNYERVRAAEQPEPPPNLLLSTLVPPTGPEPFYQLDWQNPTTRKSATQDFVYNATRFLPVTAGPAPFFNADWQNPWSKVGAHAAELYTTAFILASTTAPFAQYDWPNPTTRRSQTQDHEYNATWFLPVTVTPRPFNQYDWQNPTTRKSAVQDHVVNLTWILPAGTVLAPFAQHVWDNPTWPFRGAEHTLSTAAIAPYQIVFPVLPDNPTVQKGRVSDWQYGTVLLYLPVVQGPPFYQLDWQNPTTRKSATQDWRYTTLPSQRTDAKTFSQYDWPNPQPWKNIGWNAWPMANGLVPNPPPPPPPATGRPRRVNLGLSMMMLGGRIPPS